MRNLSLIAILIFVALGGFLWWGDHDGKASMPTPSPSASSSATAALSPTPSTDTAPNSNTSSITAQHYYYPIKGYTHRITNRWYGKKITTADRNPLPCGFPFEGYHTGDDLEVTAAELITPVPVYAIADGTVLRVDTVNGYGGLIVIKHELDGQAVTAYYGHINVNQATIKASDTVKAGQQLTVLGDNCSSQTDGERKHLHFDIHAGNEVDVRGYAPTQAELANWINPKEALAELKAQEPGQ